VLEQGKLLAPISTTSNPESEIALRLYRGFHNLPYHTLNIGLRFALSIAASNRLVLKLPLTGGCSPSLECWLILHLYLFPKWKETALPSLGFTSHRLGACSGKIANQQFSERCKRFWTVNLPIDQFGVSARRDSYQLGALSNACGVLLK